MNAGEIVVMILLGLLAVVLFVLLLRAREETRWQRNRVGNLADHAARCQEREYERQIVRLRDEISQANERGKGLRDRYDELDQRYRALRSIVIDFVRLRSKPLTVQWDKRQGAHGERLYFVYDPQTRKATLATLDEFDPAVIGAPKEL